MSTLGSILIVVGALIILGLAFYFILYRSLNKSDKEETEKTGVTK